MDNRISFKMHQALELFKASPALSIPEIARRIGVNHSGLYRSLVRRGMWKKGKGRTGKHA